ncbi:MULTISPECIES: hypothetical protein [unclassified Caballeronia]|jgi:hypothetical protein|uniref:hypothetical protein n=1 Tax=unclassified Caballeronia TaxID=2646786 RepID=UPI0020295ACD|nr:MULTISPECIES: hypothetical protein [unclassified Caballeronia]MDR5770691.1 hypothetical protein [Caballeronia sp. LZ002]MDR5802916.1 hypothetical protein [Caballeronia sp. LZ001]MDR5846128.1 hypothetical protein [Caballeronia sp. LZ003]
MSQLKSFFGAAFAAALLVSVHAQAQSSATGPIATSAGALNFLRDESGFAAVLGTDTFDRFDAKRVVHFDQTGASDTLTRSLVQTDVGPVLYDFRHKPPLVQRIGKRLVVKRVFWQGEEVVMQTSSGWYGYQRGTLIKLQSSTSTYH